MHFFYDSIDHDSTQRIEQLTRLIYELRENRKALLARHQVEDEAELLAAIHAGRLAEHPAYDDYLGLHAVRSLRENLRAELAESLKEANR